MTKYRLSRAAALALLMTAGCSGGGSSTPITVSNFCEQKAEAECQVVSQCAPITMDACTTARKSICMAFATQATSDPKRVFTPANISDCIGKIKAAYGNNAPITPTTLATIDRACNYVFQGAGKALTDSCTTRYDCAGSTSGSVICDKGLCATQTTISANQPCGNPGEVCATNNYCAKNSGGVFVCMAAGQAAATCDATTPCAQNLRCGSGTCTTLVAAGGACTADGDCVASEPYCDPFVPGTPACDQGLSFAPGSASCTAFITPSTGGGGGAGGGTGAGGSAGASGAAGAGTGGAAGAGTAGAAGAGTGGAAGAGTGGTSTGGAAGAGTGGAAGGGLGGAILDG